MRALGIVLLFGIAALAGLVTSEIVWRLPACREVIARVTGRGELRAVVGSVGIYDRGGDGDLEDQIIAENLRRVARDEPVADSAVNREVELLRHQFGGEKTFATELQASGSSLASLQADVAEHLRGRAWIEKQIAGALGVTDEECRQWYDANREQFLQPQRFRASHLFLAAPDGTPAEVIEFKQKAIKALAARLAKGETLAVLAAEASEDEATKRNGGDLGYFSAGRMPPEFIEQVAKLRLGQISAPIRTHLGFHIVQLTEVKPPRELTFAEARAEIATRLANEKREAAVAGVVARLSVAEFVRAR